MSPQIFFPSPLYAMRQLESSGRSNILYGLACGLGVTRADGSDSLFPTRKMITGLLEYSVNFLMQGIMPNMCLLASFELLHLFF